MLQVFRFFKRSKDREIGDQEFLPINVHLQQFSIGNQVLNLKLFLLFLPCRLNSQQFLAGLLPLTLEDFEEMASGTYSKLQCQLKRTVSAVRQCHTDLPGILTVGSLVELYMPFFAYFRVTSGIRRQQTL